MANVNLIDSSNIKVTQSNNNISLDFGSETVVDSIRSKNMCNISASGIYTNGSGTVASDNAYYDAIIDVSNYDSVYISGDFSLLESSLIRVGKYTTYPVIGATGTRTSANQNGVLNVSGINYLLLAFAPASSSISLNQIKSSFMVEEGDTETTYSPYQNLTGEENYSTGETIIGTWINGKPLYRKVIVLGSITVNSVTSQTLESLNITNVSDIFVNVSKSFVKNSSNEIRPLPGAINTSNINYVYCTNTRLYRYCTDNTLNGTWNICLEYTKTTD
jgi:hypothetical protein